MLFTKMKPLTSSSLFDPSLTPHNAPKKGFTYIDDVIYDLLNPSEAMKDILEFAREFHCKLGTPNSTNPDECFGLYMPVKSYDEQYQTK